MSFKSTMMTMKASKCLPMMIASWMAVGALHAEVTFRVDFEESLTPSVAEGTGEPEVRGEVSYVDGVEGKAAVLRTPNRLSYASAGNVSLDAGTIQLWVKPLNWNWQATPFVEFFRVDDTEGDRSTLRLYKYMTPGREFGLVGLIGRMVEEAGKPQWTVARHPVQEVGQGEWAHLALAWDRATRLMRLYYNGSEIAYITIPEAQWPPTLAERFLILNTAAAPREDGDETAVDLLEIRSNALTAEEIFSNYQRQRPAAQAAISLDEIKPSFLTIPRLTGAPEIDGHYGANEWGGAATVSGFAVFGQPRSPAGQQTVVHVGYDDENLYVAYLSIIPQGVPQTATAKDGNDLKAFATDDSVELLVNPGEGDGPVYQLLVNAEGVIAGLRGDSFADMKTGWVSGARAASHVYEGRWLVEIALPRKVVGLEGDKALETARLNFCRNWAGLDSTGAALSTSWSFASTAFAKDLASTRMVTGKPFASMSIDSDALAQRRLSGTVSIQHPGAEGDLSALATVRLRGGGNEVLKEWKQEVSVTPLSGKELSYELPVETPVAVAEITVEEAGGKKLLSHEFPLQYPVGLAVTPVIRAGEEMLEVHIQYAGLLKGEGPVAGKVELQTLEGKKVADLAFTPGAQSGEATLDLKGIEDGRYQLAVSISQEEKEVAQKVEPFEKMLNPVWLKERVGISREVLPPWTPMEVSGRTISVWGRTYTYGEELLPSAVVSAGKELFTAPARVEVRGADGAVLPLSPATFELEESAPDRVVIVSERKGERLTLKARTTIEYDGMAKMELSLVPAEGGVSLKGVQLCFPLAKEPEMLIHAHSFAWSNMIRERLGAAFQSRFFPYFWLGSDDRGLAWFTESDEGWSNEAADKVIHAEVKGDKVELTVNLIDHATELHKPLFYTFGYQATPVKPPLATHRKMRLHSPSLNLVSPWAMRDKNLKQYDAGDPEWGWLAPQVTDYEGLKEEFAYWRGRGVSLPVYFAPTITSPLSPAYQLFKEQWRNPHGSYPFACTASTFTDELLWHVEEMRKNAGMDGVYVDCGWAYSCGNQHHGCGYVDAEGRVRLTYPIFALREQFRRLYTLFHSNGAKGLNPAPIWVHASGLAAAPTHSFVDTLTQGEEVRHLVIANPRYMEIYSPDTWRITYGPSLGINMSFLPTFVKPVPDEIRYDPARNAAFVAYSLLHDTAIMEGFSSPAYLREVYLALDEEGFREDTLEFIPYWRQKFAAADGAKDILISVYTLPTHALVVIANTGKEVQEADVKFSPGALNWATQEVKASLLVANEGELKAGDKVKVQPENFVVLKVVPAAQSF